MLVTWHSEFWVSVHPSSWKCGRQDKPTFLNCRQNEKTHHDNAFNHINTFFPLHNTLIHLLYVHSHFLWSLLEFFVLNTCRLCKSWTEGAALLLLFFPPGWAKADDLSTTRILMTISAWYLTIPMIVEMTIQNPSTSLFGDHAGKQWAGGHQKIPSHQHLENELRKINHLLRQHNLYIGSVGRSISFRRRRMNVSLHRWHPRRYPIMLLNDCIRLLMYILTRGMIQMKPVSNWLHGQLQLCGDMSLLLSTWQASSSAQITMPRQPFPEFRRWSWHVWSL